MKFYAHPQNDHTVINSDGHMFSIGNDGKLTNKRVFWGKISVLSEIPQYQAKMMGWL